MARRIIAEFDAVDGPFIRKLRRIDQSINRFEKGTLASMTRVERSMDSLVLSASRFRTITGLIATGLGTNLASGFLDQAKLIRNALREAGDESDEMFRRVYQASVRSLAGFRDFTAATQRFQKALAGRQSLQQTVRDVETLNKLLALGGKTTQERSSTQIQFSQALQAGYLQGEELRAVRENAPIELTRAIAREAGGTIEDLKDLAAQGALTTDVMIRALRSLEEEADERFLRIQITLQDAARVFQSGAIVAAESFDETLGLSNAAISAMRGLGQVLGENAEAAAVFGEAVKLAAGGLAAAFAGRRILSFTDAMRRLRQARMEDYQASRQQLIASSQQVVAQRKKVSALRDAERSMTLAGASQAKMAANAKRLAREQTKLTSTLHANRQATLAFAAAQQRLALTSRALGAAGAAATRAFQFLGGVPGLILIAGSAFLMLSNRVESAAEKMERLRSEHGQLDSATQNTITLMEELNRVIRERGDASDEASRKAVRLAEQEFRIQQNAARRELRVQQSAQAERVKELARLRAELAGVPSPEDLMGREQDAQLRGPRDAEARALFAQRLLREYMESTRELRDQIQFYEDQIAQSAGAIREAQALIYRDPGGALGGPDEEAARVSAILEKYDDMTAKLADLQETRARLVQALGQAVADGDESYAARLTGALEDVSGEIDKLVEDMGTPADRAQAILAQVTELRSLLDRIPVDQSGEARDRLEGLRDRVTDAMTEGQNLDTLTLAGLRSEFEAVIDVVDELLASMGLVRQQAGGLGTSMKDVYETYQRTRGHSDRTSRAISFSDAAGRGIFDLIGAAEGTDRGRGYNETLGYGRFTGGDVNLTSMTLDQVLALQRRMLAHPENTFNSSAVGRYQIVSRTLRDLMSQMNLSGDEMFDEQMQDRLAAQLLRRRRGQGLEGLRNEWEGLRRVDDATINTALGQQSIAAVDPQMQRERNSALEEEARIQERALEARQQLMVTGQQQLAQQEFELSLIGKTAAEQARLRTEFELLNRAKEEGIDVDKELTASGRTYREEIEMMAQRAGELAGQQDKLNATMEAAAEKQQFFADLQRETEDALIDVIMNARDLDDALGSLARALARAALEAALFGRGPLSGSFGTAGGEGFLSGLLNRFFGFAGGANVTANALGGVMGPSGPVRLGRYANGGIAQGPQVALFGEGSRPEAYVPLPDGRSIPVTLSSDLPPVRGGGGAGVQVHIYENANEGSHRVEMSSDGSEVMVFLKKTVGDMIEGGQFDRQMRGRYGGRALPQGG